MDDIPTTLTTLGSLVVAAGGLIVSVGVFRMVMRVERAIERMADFDDRPRQQ